MSVAVATAEEVAELRAELAELKAKIESLAGAPTAPALMTPKQVAARFRMDANRVYEALSLGKLPGERRSGRSGARACTWLVKPADADLWYDRFERRARSNQ